MPPRKTIPARICQYPDCTNRALRNHAFCSAHRATPDAVAFRTELRQATSLLADESIDTLEAERIAKREAFERRTKRGDFNKLLGAAINTMFEQAEHDQQYQREIGMLRYAMVKSIALEEDPHKMALTVARCANAIAKTTLTRHITREPEPEPEMPYWTYAHPWSKPAPREDLVQYIWRHRPKDFEQRYMIDIDQDEIPTEVTERILTEFAAVDETDNKTYRDGWFKPVPASDALRAEVLERSGVTLPPNPEPDPTNYRYPFENNHHRVRRDWWENPGPEPNPFGDLPDEPAPKWDTDADYRAFLNRFPDPGVIDPGPAQSADITVEEPAN